MNALFRVAFVVSLFLTPVLAQEKGKTRRGYPPDLPEAKSEVYKTIGDVKLSLFIFSPPDHKPSDQRPAIVFFFGGGWQNGSPGQFHEHCKYLASRGMVAITADYRVGSRQGVKAVECVRDAKSAIRWVRKEAKHLGIDPNRIAAGGGSAGGHLAAATGVISGLDEPTEDAAISSRPNALVLFNPALVLESVDGLPTVNEKRAGEIRERFGIAGKEISPYHHVSSGAPPTIIFHGKADSTVPYRTAELFTDSMKKAGNRCELVGFDGQQHGFFNFGRGDNSYYRQTTRQMDEFLTSLGYLKGPPTLESK